MKENGKDKKRKAVAESAAKGSPKKQKKHKNAPPAAAPPAPVRAPTSLSQAVLILCNARGNLVNRELRGRCGCAEAVLGRV